MFFTKTAQRVLEAFGLSDEVDELEGILLGAGKPPSIQVEVEIPPPSIIVRDFVGRVNELQEFRDWFSSDDEPVRVIAGGGGTGKSALAYQVALEQSRLPVTRLNFIIWMSAKQRRLVGGKTVQIKADIYDDSDALAKLQAFFGGDGKLETETVFDFLNEIPGLIIADDVDSLSGDGGERAKTLLTREIPYRTKTKVLATSRRQLFGLESVTTTPSGFSEAETGKFVHQRLIEQDINVAFDSSHITVLRQATDGVPLYVEDLLRFIQTLDFETALKQWRSASGEETRAYVLEREFEEITEDARRVLLAAARMGGPASAVEISAILRLSDAAVLSAVNELRNLFFRSRPSFVEGVPRFTVPATTVLLVDEVLQGTYEYEEICKAVDYYLENADVPGYERGRIGEIFRTIQLLIERSELNEAERTLEQGLADLPSNPDLLGFRGYLYKHWSPPRLVDADDAFSAAADLHCKAANMYWQWADLHMLQKDYENAAAAAERGLEECGDSPHLLRIAGAARRDSGNRAVRNFETGRALAEYRKASAHFRNMLNSNRDVDPRWHISVRDHCTLNIYIVELMSGVDTDPRYQEEIRRLALAWREADPDSEEPFRWLGG